MPRKLRVPKRRRVALRLKDLPLDEVLNLQLSWSPSGRGRWPTWAAYLETYLAVRDELLAQVADHAYVPARTPFAEWVYRYQQTYGPAALRRATYEDVYSFRDDDEAA